MTPQQMRELLRRLRAARRDSGRPGLVILTAEDVDAVLNILQKDVEDPL